MNYPMWDLVASKSTWKTFVYWVNNWSLSLHPFHLGCHIPSLPVTAQSLRPFPLRSPFLESEKSWGEEDESAGRTHRPITNSKAYWGREIKPEIETLFLKESVSLCEVRGQVTYLWYKVKCSSSTVISCPSVPQTWGMSTALALACSSLYNHLSLPCLRDHFCADDPWTVCLSLPSL